MKRVKFLFWMSILMFSLTSIVLFSFFAYLEPSVNNLLLIMFISTVGYLGTFLYIAEYIRAKEKQNI
jgi:pilus assembly protein TadC